MFKLFVILIFVLFSELSFSKNICGNLFKHVSFDDIVKESEVIGLYDRERGYKIPLTVGSRVVVEFLYDPHGQSERIFGVITEVDQGTFSLKYKDIDGKTQNRSFNTRTQYYFLDPTAIGILNWALQDLPKSENFIAEKDIRKDREKLLKILNRFPGGGKLVSEREWLSAL